MSRVATATISFDALKHNLSIVRQLAPGRKILAIIKADAYGHGLLTVADGLQDVDALAVAHIEEAATLRQKTIDKTIVLLQGFIDESELKKLCSLCVEPVIHSSYQITILEKTQLPENFRVWLKVDTGMNRLGFSKDEISKAWSRLNKIPQLKGRVRLMSHFANADDLKKAHTHEQIDQFNSMTAAYSAEKSLANSAGIMGWPQSHYEWVRPGIMLYGVSPFMGKTASAHNLKPVMTLQSGIISINHIKKSQTVGYGSCWQTAADTQIAVVGCGYGDGYPRHIAEGTKVLINNELYPIVGRVSMDMLCVDVGADHRLQVGDSVTLWGDGLPVEYVAEQAGTIAYELLCQVTSRVHFKLTDNGKN